MMECNRDEATRAKEIAERKFTAKDVAGAKKFALKAVNLYPGLEGISQMLATFDVYLASDNKISGETDWYAILNVPANADDDTVKKQYRKLALTLHPDKNKSIGAEGAFKLLSEAWSVLSDRTRRSAYDQKRTNAAKLQQQKTTQPNKNPPASNANGFYNNAKNSATSNTRPQKNAARPPPAATPASRPAKPNTFWTACNRCKMQYEYLRVYLNHNLLCPNCHQAFLAVETATPANGANASVTFSFPQQRQQNKGNHVQGRNTSTIPNVGHMGYTHVVSCDANFQWGPFSRTAGIASATASSSAAAQAANMVHQTYEKVRREREEAQAAAKREEGLRRKSARRVYSTNYVVPNSKVVCSTNVDRERPVTGVERPAKRRRDEDGSFDSGDPSVLEIRNLLMEKARMEIRNKLNEWSLATATKSVEREKVVAASKADDTMNVKEPKKADSSTEAPSQSATFVVPDPDFHDFDKDRTEAAFEANQVWAAYDDSDGMPRFYALIHKVISLEPFKMRFSWLNSKTNSELGPLNWVASGFTKTCGEFRVGRYEVNNTVNVFSHRVRWEKGVRGIVKILPKKGEVWALYRNWSPDWNETTPNAVIYKYDMVEVLEDYNEEGVSVTHLVKVPGFKAIFFQHPDPARIKRIPREEMFCFSHQVPSWLLTGDEAGNAPKGCRELDPAATPQEFLHIITEAGGENVIKKTEIKEEKMVENAEVFQVKPEEREEEKVLENNEVGKVLTETREEKAVEKAELPQAVTAVMDQKLAGTAEEQQEQPVV